MSKITQRRSFLKTTSLAGTGLLFFSSSLAKAFNDDEPFKGYNPYVEEKNDLRQDAFGKHITIKGQLFDTSGSSLVSDALIEVWHLSPNSSKYRNQGKFKTDETGNYRFITDFPNREYGKSARIFFKITKAEKTCFTELILTETQAHITDKHWEANHVLGKELFPKREIVFDHTTVTFNMTLNKTNY